MSSKSFPTVESNPAVFQCVRAWRATYEALCAEDKKESAVTAAWAAYLNAMPPLSGVRNTRNFVACVTYAFLGNGINAEKCSRLLYAAQVAHSTHRTRKRREKSANSSPNKRHPEAIQAGVSAIQEPSSQPVHDA